ncbi:MAG: protein tyrosine phosphatase [Gemmatimonadota bacterium]|nr:protein tyrosine phosphatase [Gemmatimonadota bacterium]
MESLLTAVRQAPDRVLHQVRKLAAEAVVSRPRHATRVLVVCHGNICRSPFAAVILGRWLATAGVSVESAGFVGPGRRSPPEAIHAANRRGVNLSTHRSRALTRDMLSQAGLVVTMDAAQARAIRRRFATPAGHVLVLGDFDPLDASPRGIEDPFGAPPAVYDAVYARIERCAAELAGVVLKRPLRAG